MDELINNDQVQDEPVTGNKNSGETMLNSVTGSDSVNNDSEGNTEDDDQAGKAAAGAELQTAPEISKDIAKMKSSDGVAELESPEAAESPGESEAIDEPEDSEKLIKSAESAESEVTDKPGDSENLTESAESEATASAKPPDESDESQTSRESEESDQPVDSSAQEPAILSEAESVILEDLNVAAEAETDILTGAGTQETDISFDYSTLTREDLISRLETLLETQNVQDIRSDVDHIKLNYYKKLKSEIEQKRKKYVEEGGDIDDFKAPEDLLEPKIKDLLKRFREKKSQSSRQIETEKHENLEKKYAVIEKIKDLINRKESIDKTFHEFRELQKEWRYLGLVPQQHVKDLWETYNHHVEKFYDYIKINKELRDLDLKKNLEAKIILCEKAEKLLIEPSVINAFKILQKFHDQWREIGPVPAEIRAEIWERFKDVTSKINKKHQDYFEDLRSEQKKNLEQKSLLCEKAEEISNLVLKTNREWDQKSNELIELQKVWRTIGFAPKKDNNKIYNRFRSACDAFFVRKREFYSQNKELQLNNLQLKTDLCVQAETLRDSDDWKKTTEDLINLQKKWKEIGPVPRKHADQIWKRFRAACDHFFQKKSEYFSSIDKNYEDNLSAKKKLIKEIEDYRLSGNLEQDFSKLNEFQRKWTEIGFVPLKDKDNIQEKYRIVINRHFDNLNVDNTKRNLLKFRNRVDTVLQKPKSSLKLRQEREKYVLRLQQMKNDIVLWENNVGFFTSSKNADAMISEVKKKITNAKETITLLEAKIDYLDNLDID